jgi:drug/metabolite transporter (DMT)-like permease
MLIAVVPTAILSVTFEGWPKIPPAPALVPLLIYVGPLALGFGFWAAVTVMRDLPAITTSIGFLGVPASGLIFAALILGERVPFTDLAGFALIAAGVGMVSLADRSRARAG